MDDRTAASGIDFGRGRAGFGTALIAVFLAGLVTRVVTSPLSGYESAADRTTKLLVATFAGILISALAIKLILGFMDAAVSLAAAVAAVAAGSLLALVIDTVSTPARLNAETHAAHSAPAVLPVVGFGFNAFGALLGIAILFGQALMVQSFSRATT